MAGTPQVGVKAVIENYDQFISGLKQMQQAVVTMGEASGQAAQPMREMGISANDLVNKLAGLAVVRQVYADFKDFMVQGVQTAMAMEQLSVGTQNLARTIGETGDAMVQAIQEASGGTIGGLAAMRAANQATIMGVVQNKEEMADLTRIAVGLGRAMGKDAASSLEDMTIALGRNSPRILDNLGLIVKIADGTARATREFKKSAEALTEEEAAWGFRQAALEKGREVLGQIGDTSQTTATKVERLTTKWGELRTEMGKAGLAGVNLILPGLETGLDQYTQGAKAWETTFDTTIPKMYSLSMEKIHVEAQLAGERDSEAYWDAYAATIPKVFLPAEMIRKMLIADTKDFDEFMRVATKLAKTGIVGTIQADYLALTTSAKSYEAVKKAAIEASAAIEQYASTSRAARQEEAAGFYAMEHAGAYYTPARYLTENLVMMDWWRREQQRVYGDIGKASIEWVKQVDEGLDKSRDATADYINGIIDMQNQLAESAANAGREYADAMKDRDESVENAYESHNEKLADIAQEREEKIKWVMEGAHMRTPERNAEDLAYWNDYYDRKVKKTEEAYIKENNTINEKLRERQAAIAEQQAKERQQAEEQRRDMALQTTLGILEATGQLTKLMPAGVKTAQEAFNLIKSGMVPLQGELATALSTAWSTLNTNLAQSTATAQTNLSTLQSILDGLYSAGTQATTASDEAGKAVEGQKYAYDAVTGAVIDLEHQTAISTIPITHAIDQVSMGLDNLKKKFEELPPKAKTTGEDASSGLKEGFNADATAGELVAGFIKGVDDRRADIVDAGGRMATALDDGIRGEAGIASPADMTIELGSELGEGLVLGWNQTIEDIPKESAEFLRDWFKWWWFEVKDQLGTLGKAAHWTWIRDQLASIMENLTIGYGETYEQALTAMLDDYISRLPEHARADFERVAAVLRREFPDLLAAIGPGVGQPIVSVLGPYLSMAGTLSGAAGTFLRLMQQQAAEMPPSANQLAYFDALRQGSVDLLNINRQINDERQTGLELEQQMADLQSLQGQLEVLEAEKSLVDMIQEYGLSYQAVLGGLTLGLGTDLEALTQASIRALQMVIAQTSSELENLPLAGLLPGAPGSPAFPGPHTPAHEIPQPELEPPLGYTPNPNEGETYYDPTTGHVYIPSVAVARAGPSGVSVNFTGAITVSSPMDLATVGSYIKQVVSEAIGG